MHDFKRAVNCPQMRINGICRKRKEMKMKQKFCKKLLLIVTAVMMLCSALPLQTFTQVSAASDYEIVTLPAPDGYGQKKQNPDIQKR